MTDDPEDLLAQVFESGRINAIFSWIVVGLFILVWIESVLDGDTRWIIFTAGLIAIVLAPPVSNRSPMVMLPWELLVLASFPVVARTLEISQLANDFATYLSIAAVALIIIVELHILSRVNVTHWFAISTVVLATMAGAAAWAIVRWNMDRYLGTEFLLHPEDQDLANEALMHEFGWVMLAGLVAGILFDLYFRKRAGRLRQSLMWVVRR